MRGRLWGGIARMSEGASQGTRRPSSARAKQAKPAPLQVQQAAIPLAAPDTTSSAAPQALPAAEASAQPAPDSPPIGERWGEFPTKERQAELTQMLQVRQQESDHVERSGPFAGMTLTGADVYWLAAQ